MRRLTCSLLVALALVPATARAETPFCAGAEFSDGALSIGRIKAGAPRIHFVSNGGDEKAACPSITRECQEKAFLVPGDFVVIGKKWGDFLCVDYSSDKASRPGWLPAAAVEPTTASTDFADWTGDWKQTEAEIKIKDAGGVLTVDANATYGALDPERVKRGAVNVGEFSGPLVLKEGQGTYTDKDDDPKNPADAACRVRMARAGDFLFVRDNGGCGGMNVTFAGVYRRARK